MRKLFSLIVVLFSFNLSAHAQTYIFTGDVSFDGTTISTAFDNATTFTALLTFDTSQIDSDALWSYESGGYDAADYSMVSLVFTIGGQNWTQGGSSGDHIYIANGSATGIYDGIVILGLSDQALGNGYTISSTRITGRTPENDLFNNSYAINLLSYNDTSIRDGRIWLTSGGGMDLSNITMTTAVPEPATWLMMLIGFGMVASVQRRRRRVLALQTLKAAL